MDLRHLHDGQRQSIVAKTRLRLEANGDADMRSERIPIPDERARNKFRGLVLPKLGRVWLFLKHCRVEGVRRGEKAGL